MSNNSTTAPEQHFPADKYSFGHDCKARLKDKLDINYADEDCPVCFHSLGWDWEDGDAIKVEVPSGVDSHSFLLQELRGLLVQADKRWPEAKNCRFMLVRSQMFIDEAHDDAPRFVCVQQFHGDL